MKYKRDRKMRKITRKFKLAVLAVMIASTNSFAFNSNITVKNAVCFGLCSGRGIIRFHNDLAWGAPVAVWNGVLEGFLCFPFCKGIAGMVEGIVPLLGKIMTLDINISGGETEQSPSATGCPKRERKCPCPSITIAPTATFTPTASASANQQITSTFKQCSQLYNAIQ